MLNKDQVEKLQRESAGDDKLLSMVFDALGDPGRLQIFKILLENENVCVSDVANILGISVPAASKQLTILEISGLVEKIRKCSKVLEENPTTKSIIKVLKMVEA